MSNLYRAEAAAALQQLEVVRSRLEAMLRAAHEHIDTISRENAHLREEIARLHRASGRPSGEYPLAPDDETRRLG